MIQQVKGKQNCNPETVTSTQASSCYITITEAAKNFSGHYLPHLLLH